MVMETGEVLVIDLFAGPGGLGEGISSVVYENGNLPFQIGVSVEKEPSAHKTLTTRAFYRKIKDLPNGLNDYIDYVQRRITRTQLFELYPEQAISASNETLDKPRALGEDNVLIYERIRELIAEHNGPKVLIGGPPCQAYSLAGRSRNAGVEKYDAAKDHRNFLYLEYLKVLAIAQPDVFVMENVRGILSAKLNDKIMFPNILKDLRKPSRVTKVKGGLGYRIYSLVVPSQNPRNPQYQNSSDFLIRSENYGVPQARHRVILIGVREDRVGVPDILKPLGNQVTVQEVLSDLPKLRSGFSKRPDVQADWEQVVTEHANYIPQLLREKFGKEATEHLNLLPLSDLDRVAIQYNPERAIQLPIHLTNWYLDNHPFCVLNHETRGHMESDLLRYGYSAAYTALNNGITPKAKDFPVDLAPNHDNWTSGSHADRFRTQSATKCSTTVTSHISKDGHYFIHYDPQQCRSLTVREAARLQTFPDNYLFEGNRTQQYVQVGNAVPPFLAQQIGHVVMDLLSQNE